MSELMYVIESHEDQDRRWNEASCGATGPGLTRFASRDEAEAARASLIGLGEGWNDANTRVRDLSVPAHEREAQS